MYYEAKKDIYLAFDHIEVCLAGLKIGNKYYNSRVRDVIYHICEWLKGVYCERIIEGWFHDIEIVIGFFNVRNGNSYGYLDDVLTTIDDYMKEIKESEE